ncbi:MAG: ABC transporter ATP-binding protein [Candidatus Diapherotrites archaeon]|jgi:NitT/TauT family transport system ATP-binding protein|uniref:ABC transporter ATP-binding protein n=1 Tax=Candidatus Iainarchaeum sp. TaxID=3101447 RepID=A0A8T5GFY2_9ARCH|nr:ABC transporter ATP-binding protein [Candidatus Diapherotrites archaeon]
MLTIKKLNFTFNSINGNKTKKILNNISLNIENGELVSILGPSGCGKTTFANLLAGYLKPSGGKIILNEKEINRPGKERFVINQENDLFEWMTVKENIAFVTKKPIKKYLEIVHLTGNENKYPHELSGGMKKRASIARALALETDVLIFDEAFSSLDYQVKENIYLEILEIWKKTKKTIILITHDIEEAIFLSNKIVILSKNPATIKNTITVPFKRPRKNNIKESVEFTKIKKLIQKSID